MTADKNAPGVRCNNLAERRIIIRGGGGGGREMQLGEIKIAKH